MAEIVTLTMNPAIDVATSVEEVVPTSKLRCGPVTRSPGGGGINVARVLRRLGQEVVAAFPAGGPTGELLVRLVREEGVDARVVPIAGDTRESFTVLDERATKEFRFVLPGPRFDRHECGAALGVVGELIGERGARYAVLSGSLPGGIPRDFYAAAAKAARAAGAKVVVDSHGEALDLALRGGGLTLVKPSRRELSEILDKPLDTRERQLAECRRLVAAGGAEWVALTLGGDGAMLVGREAAYFAPAVPVETRSAVGAGDSFLGAMVARLAEGKDPKEAFRAAVAAGSAALLTSGTALCHAEDVERLTPLVEIEELA